MENFPSEISILQNLESLKLRLDISEIEDKKNLHYFESFFSGMTSLKTLVLHWEKASAQLIELLLKSIPSMRSLTIEGLENNLNLSLEHSNLSEFIIKKRTDQRNESIMALIPSVKFIKFDTPNLKSLQLDVHSSPSFEFPGLYKGVLEELLITNSMYFDITKIKGFSFFHNVHKLSISQVKFDSGLVDVILREFPNLKELKIDFEYTAPSFELILNHVKLEKLEVNSLNNPKKVTIKEINLPNLRYFSSKKMKISLDGISPSEGAPCQQAEFITNLSDCLPNLEHLDFEVSGSLSNFIFRTS